MNIVVKIEPFLKQLDEVSNLYDLKALCLDISRNSSLQIKKRLLEVKAEQFAESILGRPWQRSKPNPNQKFICGKCKKEVSSEEIKRNGHYPKGLNFEEGYAKLRIPLLVHKNRDCLGVIQIQWPFLEKRKRIWVDLIVDIVSQYFEGVGLRGIKRVLEARQGTSYGVMSIWRVIQRVGQTLRTCCTEPTVAHIKAVGLDEIFMRLRVFQGKGKKALKKILYGLMAKGVGKNMPLLSFGISLNKNEAQWQKEIDSLHERGVNHDNGLEVAIVDGSDAIANAVSIGMPFVQIQECIFHIHRDLIFQLREKYGRKSKRVKEIVKAVKNIFKAESLQSAENKLERLSTVSKLVYQFLQTKKEELFTYFNLPFNQQDKEELCLKTNNVMERENREIKKRLKPMLSFKSEYGAENFAAIMLRREFYRIQNQPWIEKLFSEISISPKPIEKPPPSPDIPSLTSSEVEKLVGVRTKTNKKINYELPILRTADNFGLGKLKELIEGDSIFGN